MLSGSRDCGLDDGPCAGRRSTCTGGRSEAEDGGQDGFFVLREETRVAWRGKKPAAPLKGNDRGPNGPLPLGDTVHRQRPNTCVTASGKRTTDLGHRHHDDELLRAGRSKAETVKQADQAAREHGHEDFGSLAMAARRPDKACKMDGEIRALRLDELGRSDATASW